MTIRGANVDLVRQGYALYLGDTRVSQKLIRKSSKAVIEFQTQSDPGRYEVSLVPLDGLGASLVVGTVTVEKFILPSQGMEIVPGQIQVRLAPGVAPETVADGDDRFERQFPDEALDSKLGRWYVVGVAEGSEVNRIERYASADGVEVAQFTGVIRSAAMPNDPCYQTTACGADQWGVRASRLPSAWEVRTQGVAIAIVDSGLPATHPDLGQIDPIRDFTGTGTQPCGSHGLAVATTAAARGNNAQGLAGASWGTRVGSYKVLGFDHDCTGGTTTTTSPETRLQNAVQAAVNDGFVIINASVVGYAFSATMNDVIVNAWNNRGVLLVASAGNNNCECESYPARYDVALSVAASDWNDARGTWAGIGSNFGTTIDITAPGVNIPGAILGGGYGSWSGTSMAAPLVSGTAALLRAQGLNHVDTRARLLSTADPLSWFGSGAGRLNAYRALVPARNCIRDFPAGSWVRRDNGAIYQKLTGNNLRQAPDWLSFASWIGADADKVSICEARFAEMTVGQPMGYRPASLIRDPGDGAVWLITTDGTDRGLPVKRQVTPWGTLACFGWGWGHFRDGAASSLALHPTGAPINSCNSLLRVFPNGSVIRDSTGRIFVVENGAKRPVPSWGTHLSWFRDGEWSTVTDAESAALGTGPNWGYRPGKQVQPAFSAAIFVVADDGAVRAQGSRRQFADAAAWVERSYNAAPYEPGVPFDVLALHPVVDDVRNADWMP